MLKQFLALPAVLRVAVCLQSGFNVYSDLLAFPQVCISPHHIDLADTLQYEVVFDTKSYIHASDAEALLEQDYSDPLLPLQKNDEQSTFDTPGDVSLRVGATGGQSDHDRPSHERDTYEYLFYKSRPHLCTIPYVAAPLPENSTTTPKHEEQQELARATDHGLELLKDMQGSCIYYAAGWWVYSFCYNEGIRQFHPLPPGRNGVPPFPPVEDRNIQSYLLGQFAKPDGADKQSDSASGTDVSSSSSTTSGTSALVSTQGPSNYLVQSLSGGTTCDLTAKPRRIDIQYHCSPSTSDRIAMIKETASCVYLMIIHTPRLCNDVVFQPAAMDRPNTITCQEIIETAAEERDWQASAARDAEAFLRAQDAKQQQHQQDQNVASAGPLVIGGITVGGRALAGATTETTIRASNIVLAASQRGAAANAAANALANNNNNNNNNNNPNNPPIGEGEEHFVATLAKSDGKYTSSLDEAEMQRLGLKGTRAELENWNKEMRELAGEGVPWRLDVVRTREGLEFRGIVSDVEEGEAEVEETDEAGAGAGAGVKNGEKAAATTAVPGAGAGAARTDAAQGAGAGAGGENMGDDVGSEEEYK